jgi:hypothetical protein
MNSPSEDIKDMLESDPGLALTFATDLFIGKEPPEPDNCVTIFDTPGRPPQLTFKKEEDYFYPSIQIRIRNNDYRDGWSLINEIKIYLHGKAHETWNSTVYELIRCEIEPAFLNWDENNRAWFVTSFEVQRHD